MINHNRSTVFSRLTPFLCWRFCSIQHSDHLIRGKRNVIAVLFVCPLVRPRFVVSRFFFYLFLLVSKEGCDIWLWHSLEIFSLFSSISSTQLISLAQRTTAIIPWTSWIPAICFFQHTSELISSVQTANNVSFMPLIINMAHFLSYKQVIKLLLEHYWEIPYCQKKSLLN